jgi:LysR family transcriptional regulator, benzoate and cis,cis-muconate-responsive activator of ben and cat genes
MELRHLRYFVTVAEALNFTKAATKLHVAQPSLSRQIRNLEDELGVPLFERNSRFVHLTAAGTAFLSEARAVLQRAEVAAQTARAFATGERGEIHVGYAPSLTVEVLPQALRAFEKQSPRVRVHLHDLSVQEMQQGLREGRLDAALTVEPLGKQMPGLAFVRLRTYPLCVAVNPTHPLSRVTKITLARLKNERLIVYSRQEYPEYREWLIDLLGKDVQPLFENAEEHENGTSLVAAVEAARGVALVPSVLSSVAGARLTLRKLQSCPKPFSIGVVYLRRHLAPAARQFLKTVSALAA